MIPLRALRRGELLQILHIILELPIMLR